MSTYTPTKFLVPNGLDELGFKLGMTRFDNETLADFRRRLLLEARDPAGASQDDFIRSIGRQVALFDIPVFEISLITDANAVPLAPDPYIEVTSTHLRAYSDFDNSVLDFELNIIDRDSAYFLKDVYASFTASSFFSVKILDDDYAYKKSRQLKYANTNRFFPAERLSQSFEHKLMFGNIKTLHAQAFDVFINEKTSQNDLAEDGDFYIDYVNGVIFTHSMMKAFVSYVYREFPYRLLWQPVRTFPFNDPDIDFLIKDTLIDDNDAQPQHLLLNSHGAEIVNKILSIHSLGWGF